MINLNNDELQKLIDETPDLQLLDVRTPPEYYELGHIPGALLRPVQTLHDWASELDPKKPTAVVCEHGRRSVFACDALAQHYGFSTLYNHEFGMSEWNGERDYKQS